MRGLKFAKVFILSSCQSTWNWKMEVFVQNLVNLYCYNHCLLHSGDLSLRGLGVGFGFVLLLLLFYFSLMLLFLSPKLILYLDLSQKLLSLKKSLIQMY